MTNAAVTMASWVLALCLLLGLAGSTGSARAQAGPQWGMSRFPSSEVSAGTVATFRDLLQSEITQRNGVSFVDLGVQCADAACTMEAARQAQLRYAVHARVGRLGRKVVVSFAAVDATKQQVLISDTLSASGVEELDTLARRIASTIVDGRAVEHTTKLGEITREEARAPVRRDTRMGVSLGPEAIFPTRGYADRQFGVGVGIGLWFESMDFVIEPRLGYRTELTRGGQEYDHLPFDLGLYYLMSRTDISPVIGGGLGIHYLHEEVLVERQVGSVLVSSTRGVVEDSLVGFSGFLRVGLMLLRTYDVSVLIAADYALTLADFRERSDEQAVRVSLSVIVGGT